MDIVVIGAGFTGIAAAWQLSKAGHKVTLLEYSHQPGGLAAGFKADGWEWPLEYHYHHIFASDKAMLGLVADMGLESLVTMSETKSMVLYQEKRYQLDSPLSLLQLPILSVPSRLRLAASLAYLRFNPQWQNLEKVTAQEWLRRNAGQEAWQKIWQPLFMGKFGDYSDQVNAAWFWARIQARTKQLGYFKGGFLALAEAMVDVLQQAGVEVIFSATVKSIQKKGKDLNIAYAFNNKSKNLSSSKVLVAAPSPVLVKLVPDLPQTFLKKLTQLKGLGAATLILELEKPFFSDKTYWLNINEAWPLLAVVEHTHFVDPKHYGGKHLVYVGKYLEPTSEMYQLDAKQLLKKYTPYLSQLSPQFEKNLSRMWLFKTPFAQPIALINQSEQLPPQEIWPGKLFWSSMQHVYPWDRGTNFAVEAGIHIAKKMNSPIHP